MQKERERERDTGGCREREREREREMERKGESLFLSVSVHACRGADIGRANTQHSLFFLVPPRWHSTHARYRNRETCLAGGLLLDAAVGRFVSAMLGWPAERSEKMMLSI